MAGPTQQEVDYFVIPPGEEHVQFSPSELANTVQNLLLTPEGTLKSIVGPCPYTKGNQNSKFANNNPHSVFYASLLNGSSPGLFVRVGSRFFRYKGYRGMKTDTWPFWEGGQWHALLDSPILSNNPNAKFPDQWVVLNDKVIFTNGVDRPFVITYDDMVTPLGFDEQPSPPVAYGPVPSGYNQSLKNGPNTKGYAWTGNIGTSADSLDPDGGIRAGAWYYRIQYEDIHGNLSAFSAPSNAVLTSAAGADPYYPSGDYDTGVTADNLMRQFHVSYGSAESSEYASNAYSDKSLAHCVAIRLYRTPDTRNVGTEPQLLVRVPGRGRAEYADNTPDSGLGPIWEETVSVPVFKLMCTHQGRLVIANTEGEPGIVRRSQPGFAGTFNKLDYIYPDSGGSEVTGITSHAGILLAFTSNSVYSLEDFGLPRPLAQGIGCVAPSSIKALPNGLLIWLARDGFYGMTPDGQITRVSASIDSFMRNSVSRGKMSRAVATIDSHTNEYRCAIAVDGSPFNNMILCFDGRYWRRISLNLHVAYMAKTDDYAQNTLALALDYSASADPTTGFIGSEGFRETLPDKLYGDYRSEVFKSVGDMSLKEPLTRLLVLDRVSGDPSYTPPPRTIRYRSSWFRADASALTPVNVRSLFICMADSWDGNATVRLRKNGSEKVITEMNDLRLIGVDDDSDVVKDLVGSAVNMQSKFHDKRLFWRQIPVGLENVNTWCFEIEFDQTPDHGTETNMTRIELISFAFETSLASSGSPRGRIPLRADK